MSCLRDNMDFPSVFLYVLKPWKVQGLKRRKAHAFVYLLPRVVSGRVSDRSLESPKHLFLSAVSDTFATPVLPEPNALLSGPAAEILQITKRFNILFAGPSRVSCAAPPPHSRRRVWKVSHRTEDRVAGGSPRLPSAWKPFAGSA